MLHNLSLKLLTFSKWAHACPDVSLRKVPLNKGNIFEHGGRKYPPLVTEVVDSPPCYSLAGIRRLEVWAACACALGPWGPLCPEHSSAALTSFHIEPPLLYCSLQSIKVPYSLSLHPSSPSLLSFLSFET